MKPLKPLLVLLAITPALVSAQAVTFNGSVRVRTESWDWFDQTEAGEYTFTGVLGRGSVSMQRGNFAWLAEVAVPALIGLPDDAVAPAPLGQLGLGASYWAANEGTRNPVGLFVKQAWLRVGAAPTDNGHSLRLGRFEFIDGLENVSASPRLAAVGRERVANRLIGTFGFSHAQRSFEGVQYTHNSDGLNLTAVAFRPTQGVFTVQGGPALDVAVGYASLGTRGSVDARQDARVFALYYDDRRGGTLPQVEIATIGGHYLREFQLGSTNTNVLAWGALQTGNWGALDHNANAFALELGVEPALPLKPAIRAGYMRSTGDASPEDGDHGTFFQVLPTPRSYARLPFYNAMNLDDRFVSVALNAGSRVGLRAEAHRLKLSEGADAWYAGGGAFDADGLGYSARPTGGEVDLATVVDVSAQVRIAPTLSANVYVGRAFGGAVMDRIYPNGGNATLGYIEMEWRR